MEINIDRRKIHFQNYEITFQSITCGINNSIAVYAARPSLLSIVV